MPRIREPALTVSHGEFTTSAHPISRVTNRTFRAALDIRDFVDCTSVTVGTGNVGKLASVLILPTWQHRNCNCTLAVRVQRHSP